MVKLSTAALQGEIEEIMAKLEIEGDESFLHAILTTGKVRIRFLDIDDEATRNALRRMKKKGLFVDSYNRGYTSGFDWPRTKEILITEPIFQNILELTEEDFYVNHGWVLNYKEDGVHDWHYDENFCGTFRKLITFGHGKIMCFALHDKVSRKRLTKVSFSVPHGTIVYLSKEGSGIEMLDDRHAIKHKVVGNGTTFLGLEGVGK